MFKAKSAQKKDSVKQVYFWAAFTSTESKHFVVSSVDSQKLLIIYWHIPVYSAGLENVQKIWKIQLPSSIVVQCCYSFSLHFD